MNEVVLFENALRAAVPSRPDPRLGTALVPRLAAVAHAATIEAETQTQATRPRAAAPRSRLALVARVGIVVALIPLVLAGLAFAGVTVPGPARSAFHSVGITLPNQPSSHGQSASGGKRGADETTTSTTGGQAQSKGKSDTAHQHALEQHSKAQGKALGHEHGKAIGLNGSTPPGQAKDKNTSKSAAPPSHSNAGGNSATHTTTHTTPQHTTPANGNGHAKSRRH
jgi:hypothetical protein